VDLVLLGQDERERKRWFRLFVMRGVGCQRQRSCAAGWIEAQTRTLSGDGDRMESGLREHFRSVRILEVNAAFEAQDGRALFVGCCGPGREKEEQGRNSYPSSRPRSANLAGIVTEPVYWKNAPHATSLLMSCTEKSNSPGILLIVVFRSGIAD
jgi:hypothetical protein